MLNRVQIPAASTGSLARNTNCVLLWCVVGTATVSVRDDHFTHSHELRAGDLVTVPAGPARTVDVHHSSVVLPLVHFGGHITDGSALHLTAARHLGTDWTPWFLHNFASQLTMIRPQGYSRGQAADRFRSTHPVEDAHPIQGPPLPTDPTALRIAGLIHNDPSTRSTADALASTVGVSAQTLRRTFLRETGLTLSQWRTRCRLAAATEFLSSGYPVAWTADQVGFASVQGFIRCFRNHCGITPGAWGRGHRDPTRRFERVTRVRNGQALTESLTTRAEKPPDIPAADSTCPRSFDNVHDILWMYAGTARITINGDTYRLTTGDAIWIPAGSTHYTDMDAGSVGLPLMFRVDEVDVSPTDVAVVKIPPSDFDDMLFHTVANMTAIQPENYDRLAVLELFSEHTVRERERNLTMPVTGPARIVAKAMVRDLRDRRSVGKWAEEVGSSVAELNASFHTQTGRRALQWRTLARVRHAADLLASGVTPNAVAHRCGFRHLSQFSRDFTLHYGMSPRQWAGKGRADR